MSNKPTILVIFGISGDLAKRYLLPAIKVMEKAKMLPNKFKIVGITRQKNSKLYQMDLGKREDYENLNNHLNKIEKKFKKPAQRLFYLAVPPEACGAIIELIGKSSLVIKKDNKILLEKPFGTNLKSARELVTHIDKYFKPEQVYRIDHYMAKEAVQNMIVFRDRNSLFKKTWNKDFIESIEISASEKIDIEGRIKFYEQTGALRDVVQSHLLQLAALTLMDLPRGENLKEVPALRFNALKHLRIIKAVKRGQYQSYRREVKNKKSLVETFVSLKLESTDPRWSGVPITLATGKALAKKFTEIKITYKKVKQNEADQLLIRIQPNAGIELDLWAKTPGYEHKASRHVLHFLFKEHYKKLPEAYEQVLFNAINSDHSLFTSGNEILETWRIADTAQKTWRKTKNDLILYKKGSTINDIVNK